MQIREFQNFIAKVYLEKDKLRGIDGTFMYFIEEVGELATALREEPRAQQAAEFADVLAWLMSVANLAGVDLQDAIEKYTANGGLPPNATEKP